MPNEWEVQSESDYSPGDWGVALAPVVSSRDVESKIRSTAQAHGVDPDHMVRIAKQESGFDPNAVSKKGALGVMQLMPSTAKDLGVDPFNLDQNITGGVRYYKKLLDQFGGDVSKASAAYNAGPTLIASKKPWPKETRDYVQSVVPKARLPKASAGADPWAVADEKPLDEWSVVSQKDASPFTEPIEGAPSRKQLESMAGDLEKRAQDIDLQRAAFKLTKNPSGPMVDDFNQSIQGYQKDYDAYQRHVKAFGEVQTAWSDQKRPAGAEQTGLPGVMNKLPEPPAPVELAPELDPNFKNSPFAGKPGYGIMAGPVSGIYGAVRGIERAAQGKPRDVAGGAHEVVSGAFEAATPFMIASGLSAPIKTAATVGAAMVAQGGVEVGLEALGLPKEYAAVAGDLAGIVAAATAVPAAERLVLRQRIKRVLQDRLDADFAARQAQERWARQANQEASVPRIEGTVEKPAEPFKEDIVDAEWEAPGVKALGSGRSSPHPTLKEGQIYQTGDGRYRVTYVGENEVSFEYTNKQGIRRTSSVPLEEFEQTAKRGFRVNPQGPPAPEAAAPQPAPEAPKPQPGGAAEPPPASPEAAAPPPPATPTERPSLEPGQVWEHPSAGQYRVESVSPDGKVQYTFTNRTGGVTRSSISVSSFERLTKKARLREGAEPEAAAAPGAPVMGPEASAPPSASEAPQRAETISDKAETVPPVSETAPAISETKPTIPDMAEPARLPAQPSVELSLTPEQADNAFRTYLPAVSFPEPASSLPESAPEQTENAAAANTTSLTQEQYAHLSAASADDFPRLAKSYGMDVVGYDSGSFLVRAANGQAWLFGPVQNVRSGSGRTIPRRAAVKSEWTDLNVSRGYRYPSASASAATPPPTQEPGTASATPPAAEAEPRTTEPAATEQPKQIALSGNTFPYKGVIRRQLGGKWDGAKKVWVVEDTPQHRAIVQGLSKKIVISPYGEPEAPVSTPQPAVDTTANAPEAAATPAADSTSENPAPSRPQSAAGKAFQESRRAAEESSATIGRIIRETETAKANEEQSPSTTGPKPVTVETETAHEPIAPSGEHQGPLEEVPADHVPGTPAERELGPAGEERLGSDQGRTGGPGGEGTPAQPSLGTGEGELGVPAERGRSAAPLRTTTLPESSDYRITDADRIGEGGLRQKASRNLDAIRTLKAIESEGRSATPEEQKLLVQYVGWGGMPQAFAPDWQVPRDWQGVRAELDQALTPEEFASARASTPNAHYTSPMVVRGMWRALERLGFGPNEIYSVIEPSMGVGHFFGLMPEDMAARAQRVGVELDSITGRIAKLLYPNADVHVSGFEKVKLPDDYFDLAVSNVPFGNYPVHDPAYKRNPLVTRSIHDYFFAKGLDKVRPGGIVAFITSSFTLDKSNPAMRKYLASKADLVGAIRLPNTAFKGNAGTEVTTDIIILKKRPPQTEPSGESWSGTEKIQGTQKRPDGSTGPAEIEVNEYYARHPEMMLGTMTLEGSMYAAKSPALTGDLTDELIDRAIANLPEKALGETTARSQSFDALSAIPEAGTVKEGGYTVKDGVVMVRHNDQLRPAGLNAEQAKRVQAILPIRDALREVFRTQLEDASDGDVKLAQGKLNSAYNAFVKQNGPLHSRTNMRAFADDPDAPLLLSLENWDPDTKTATKTAIFTQRTIERYRPVQSASSARDALSVSLNERGRIDWARMQELTNSTPAELQAELGSLVFQNPSGKQWEPADEYLSGNVRKKLAEAEVAARTNPNFERNVHALKAIQPADLMPEDIDARLGSSWIPKEDVKQFITELLEVSPRSVQVGHSEALGSWTVQVHEPSVANSKTWGTMDASGRQRFQGHELIEDALNLRNPTAYDYVDEKAVLNEQQTLAAREMQQQIKDRFRQWVWEHPERSERLAKAYNEEFNNLRLREYDGSHLTFPGMSAAVNLRPHQKNAVWRMLQGGNTLLAHVVGAGKTFEMIAGAMEMRRIGLARKPLLVVPKNRVEGTGADFLQLYPAANILVMSSEDFTAANRPKMMSRIATGNWDSVIVSYESFERLPISDETFNGYLQEQINDLENYILEARADQYSAKIVKELEKSKKRLEAKLRNKRDEERRDRAITFEELGVDALFVDEADNFKNLFFPTKMTRIAGIPNTESKRAFDMYIKTQYISKRNGGRGIVFATGTPIANTMAEMFTMQRYLQPHWLRDHGMQHFDAWAQTFGEVRPTLEVSPDASGFRMTNRFSRFVNIPELVSGFRLVADVQTADMLKLPTPTLDGGSHRVVSAPASPEQRAFLQELAKRSKDIRDRKVSPERDNMLKVSTDGRKAALDLRLVDPLAADFPDSKVNQCADQVAKIWKQSTPKQSTQLVFLDFSKPADPGERKFSVYDDLKAKLVARGVPAKQIAFIHDAETDAQKEKLFQAVNDGKIRVLMGSTQKMGVGLNVQKRLYAAHHLDAPWRPRDIEQRDGRILRQGNTNPTVKIFRYVTEPSFDAKMWDTLAGKAAFIGQVMRGDVSVRSAEDVSETALSFAEVAAVASGNPAIREKTMVDAEVRKLDSLRARHDQQQASAQRDVQTIPATVKLNREALRKTNADIQTRDATDVGFVVGGKEFEGEGSRKKAGEAIHALLEQHRGNPGLLRGNPSFAPVRIGTYHGIPIEALYPWPATMKNEDGSLALAQVQLHGQSTWEARTNQDTPLGTVASIESAVRSMDARKDMLETSITKLEKQLADTKNVIGKTFPQQERLKELLQRQAELAKQLQTNAADPQAVGEVTAEESPAPDEPSKAEPASKAESSEVLTRPRRSGVLQQLQQSPGFHEGIPVNLVPLREQALDKAAFDKAVLKAADDGDVVLTRVDHVHSENRDALVPDDQLPGVYYVAAQARAPEQVTLTRPKLTGSTLPQSFRSPAATDLFHGTSTNHLESIYRWGFGGTGRATYVTPDPGVAEDIAHERVEGLNPNGDQSEEATAHGGKPAIIVLDRAKLREAGVKFERDPEMSRGWRDVSALMTRSDSEAIPAGAIKRVYTGEREIQKALSTYRAIRQKADRKAGEALYAGLTRPKLKPSAIRVPPSAFLFVDAKYEAPVKGAPGHVYLNDAGLKTIQVMLGRKQDIYGITLGPLETRTVVHRLEALRGTLPEIGQERIGKMLNAISEALADQPERPYVTFVTADPATSVKAVRETRKEEEFHRQQFSRTPLGKDHANYAALAADPDVRKALNATRKLYVNASDQNIVKEMAAIIGTGRASELNLTPAEADTAFRIYVRHVVDLHGDSMKGLLYYATSRLRRLLEKEERIFVQPKGGVRRSRPRTSNEPGAVGREPQGHGGDESLSRPASASRTLAEHGTLGPPSNAGGTESEILTRPRQPGSVPHVGGIQEWLNERFGDREAGRANYSGLGALSDKFLRNLTQLEQRSPNAHTAAVRAASSRAQSATILRAAVIPIQDALKGSEFTWDELRLAMIESRLRGLKERWQDFSDQVRQMTDTELADAFDAHFVGFLDAIEGKRGLPQNLADTAASLAAAGAAQADPTQRAADYDALRQFLAQTFEDASARVATVMDPAWYDATVNDPHIQEALRIYKRTVEGAMAENHALNEGVFSDALGPLDTYYPLISIDRNPAKGGAGRRVPYHKPRNMANAFATGLSEGYDASMQALRERLAAAVRSNDKAALIQALEDEGLLHSAMREDNLFIDPRTGEGYQGERVEIQSGRQIIQNGKSTFIPPRVALAPKWLARELRPILERNQINTPTVVDKLVRAANWFSLAGPADFVFHSSNVLGALVANTPFLENTLAGKALSVPFVKKFAAVGYMLATDPTTEEAAAELIEMAKLGIIPDRYGSETFSKQAAQDLGAEHKRFTFSPALYGPKGLDIRARLLMYRLAKAINPGANPQELYHFVNQLGNYVPALQSEVERALKSSGAAPFFTAGSTMLKNGINAWTSRGPIPKNEWQLRLWQQLTGGALGALALWALTYHTATGKWPWDDKRSKLFQIPVGGGHGPVDSYRHSKLGNALWGNGPETGYINFGFFNPLVVRGSRAMGMPGAYETRVLGGTTGQSLEAAQRDILNAFLHPASGPVVKAAFVGVTGNELYVTGLRDRSGQIGPHFYPAIPPKTKPGLPALGARTVAAARELNSFYGSLGEASGFLGEDKGKKGNQWLRMGIDLVVPGLVANASNPYKRAAGIQQQKRAINRSR